MYCKQKETTMSNITRKHKVIAVRPNFEFLDNGCMRITHENHFFNSYVDALIDAVKFRGADLDDMIKMVFVQTTNDLRDTLVNLINNYKNKD